MPNDFLTTEEACALFQRIQDQHFPLGAPDGLLRRVLLRHPTTEDIAYILHADDDATAPVSS